MKKIIDLDNRDDVIALLKNKNEVIKACVEALEDLIDGVSQIVPEGDETLLKGRKALEQAKGGQDV